MAQVICFLPPVWETWIEFLASSFGSGPAYVLVAFEE